LKERGQPSQVSRWREPFCILDRRPEDFRDFEMLAHAEMAATAPARRTWRLPPLASPSDRRHVILSVTASAA
jgi:hypothetical protein